MFEKLSTYIPEVEGPTQKHLPFKTKIKWSIMVLISYFVLGVIPLFGLGQNSLEQFEYLSIILGAKFGSLISLGIGPIVTASIVLQLLTGSGILKMDLTNPEGKKSFQSLQKVLTIFFIIFEAVIYVIMGGLAPAPGLPLGTFKIFQLLLIFQLFVGGMLIVYMDEILKRWGFGSGVSLFIAAGVSATLIVRAFSPLTTAGTLALGSGQAPVGKVLVLVQSLAKGNPIGAALALAAIIATFAVFAMSVYSQAMKVEIPLSFGRIRGHGIRWPLKFIYTSNIPVILTAALLANMQLWARLLEKWGHPILGTFSGNTPITGVVSWLYSPNIVEKIITKTVGLADVGHAFVYVLFFVIGAVVFSIFWMQTSGMDAKSQARQMMASGLQIPGFRRDERVLERLLSRYILPLTIMGGITVGILAASADLMGALANGTGILLTVMIIYQLYETIAEQHMMDMYPALRKMIGK